jgi:Fe-S-cluster containining protein
MNCSCERCQSLCRNKPGWFLPEQIKVLAQRQGLGVEALFRSHLTVDAVLVERDGSPVASYVLAPAMVGKPAGEISDPEARGVCVWFRDGQCAIHEAKPLECREVDHTTTPREGDLLRASILEQWRPHKKLVQDLYGKKLKPPAILKETYRAAKKARS